METWVTINDFENYEINQLGQIRNKIFKKNQLMSTKKISNHGYKTIGLSKNGKVHTK